MRILIIATLLSLNAIAADRCDEVVPTTENQVEDCNVELARDWCLENGEADVKACIKRETKALNALDVENRGE